MIIKSSKNPVFKKLLSLTKSKGLKEEGLALVSGEKITKKITGFSHPNPFWITTEDRVPSPGSQGVHGQTVRLSKELFDCLDVCGTCKPLLCCQYPRSKVFSDLNSNLAALYVAVSDPGNLGALVRSCVAFHWFQIVLLSESSHPFLPKVIRGSSGAVFKATFFEGPSIRDLSDPEIVALDKNEKAFHFNEKKLKKNLKLLVGEEGQGIPENFSGQRLSIPISREVESLNTTVAASLVLYEWSRNNKVL